MTGAPCRRRRRRFRPSASSAFARCSIRRCVRALHLATRLAALTSHAPQLGFSRILARPALIATLVQCLYLPQNKLRALVADVLAAVCVLSLDDGHRLVLAAFSDARIIQGEKFRFESFIKSVQAPDIPDDATVSDSEPGSSDDGDDGFWEWRTAAMSLVNAIVNTPHDLDERLALRDEFVRRGLNEAMTVSFRAN